MSRTNNLGLLIVTGASGAGKTAAVRLLESRNRPGLHCFYFDSIGVPSMEVMERDYGGGEQWQAAATRRWLSRIAADLEPGCVAILDGQTRPSFVTAAQQQAPSLLVRTLLMDCSPAARRHRLESRSQPELANPQMDLWAAYLRGQADALGLPIVDTTNMTVEEVADAIEAQIHFLSDL